MKRKRKRFRSLLDRVPENLQQRVRCLGVGSTVLRVNSVYYLENGLQQNDLISSALTSAEFNSRKNNYMYFKVVGVRITVFPNVQATDKLVYINMTYGNRGIPSQTTIVADDNTKIVAPFGTRPRVFKFKPPNVTFNKLIILPPSTDISYRTYNLREWIACADSGIPESLFLTYYDSNLPIRVQTEVIVVFRGAVANSESSKIYEVLNNAKNPVERSTILEKMLNAVGYKSKQIIKPTCHRREITMNVESIKEENEEYNEKDDKIEIIKEFNGKDVPDEVIKAYDLIKKYEQIKIENKEG
jgi:hypothetical protein